MQWQLSSAGHAGVQCRKRRTILCTLVLQKYKWNQNVMAGLQLSCCFLNWKSPRKGCTSLWCRIFTFVHYQEYRDSNRADLMVTEHGEIKEYLLCFVYFFCQIHETIESINQLKIQRDFMLSFSKDPKGYIQDLLRSQSRDLKVS